jgi:hypothetical protein
VVNLFNDLFPFGFENEGYARLMKMEATFLASRWHQLRLLGNVTVGDFKRNV